MTVPFKRLPFLLSITAMLAAAPPARAQSGQGGMTQEQREAEQRKIAQTRRDLERAVERARDRIDELREHSEYRVSEARAMREAKIALERAEPNTPDFAMQLARLQELAAQQQVTFLEDGELKRAIRDMQRLHSELAVRRMPVARRGYLGVTFSSERRVGRDGRVTISFDEYPRIMTVESDSPAQQAGVQRGDVLLALDGRDLVKQGPIQLTDLLQPGRTVRLRVQRDKRKLELPVRVGYMPEVRVFVAPGQPFGMGGRTPAPAPPATPLPPGVRPRLMPAPEAPGVSTFIWNNDGSVLAGTALLGAMVTSMDRDMRDRLEVDDGVLLLRVQPRSLAADAGLKSLDVVIRIDGDRVSSPDAFRAAVDRARHNGADSVVLTVVVKDNKERKVTLRW